MSPRDQSSSIRAACTDCGKRYNVPASSIGKRVKCKSCGNTFTIAELHSKTSPKPPDKNPRMAAPLPTAVPVTTQYGLPDHAIAGVLGRNGQLPDLAETTVHPPRSTLAVLTDVISFFQPNVWVLLLCLIYAFVLACYADAQPKLYNQSLIAFPIMAGCFLLIGLISAVLSTIVAPAEDKLVWKTAVPTAMKNAVGGTVGKLVSRRRRVPRPNHEFGIFMRRVIKLVIEVLCMAAMSAVLFYVAVALDTTPGRNSAGADSKSKNRMTEHKHHAATSQSASASQPAPEQASHLIKPSE